MRLYNLFKNSTVVSIFTILLLLSSYIFIAIQENISTTSYGASKTATLFLFITILFLFLFLLSFIIIIINISHIADIYEIFQNPSKISILTTILLLCSYLSTVMNAHAVRIYGEVAPITKVLFYLGLTFLLFFIICFIAMLVAFSNKFLYSKKL